MQAEIIMRVFWESSSKGDHLAETRIPLYFFLFHLSSTFLVVHDAKDPANKATEIVTMMKRRPSLTKVTGAVS